MTWTIISLIFASISGYSYGGLLLKSSLIDDPVLARRLARGPEIRKSNKTTYYYYFLY